MPSFTRSKDIIWATNFKKLAPTVDSSELTFLPTSTSRDTKTRPNITNPTRSNLDIMP